MNPDAAADAADADALSPDVRDTVVTAYYPRAIAAADSARNRAQAGYAIASGIASGLVIAGAFSEIDERGWLAQVAGGAALVAWVVTGVLFLHAVGTPVVAALTAADLTVERASGEWVASVLRRAQAERDLVDARNLRAILATVAAVALTLPAIAITAFSSLALDKDDVTLAVTPAARAVVDELCTQPPRELAGALESRTLRREFVVLTLPAGACRDEAVVLRVPQADVRAIASR